VRGIRNLWRTLFGTPTVPPDPDLDAALQRVDEASQRLELAIDRAHRRGAFEPMRDSIRKQADKDAERIRLRGRRTNDR
jgi:hypothetical protein